MSVPTPANADLEREAELVRRSGVLGRPGPLSRLFEFLLARSSGAAPKEIEIAVEVFGKQPDFDVAQDSLVRVYVHKLRKRLDEFYTRNARAMRIVIPKGEYRLVLAPAAQDRVPAPADAAEGRSRPWVIAAAAAASLVLGALLMWAWVNTLGRSAAERELKAVRASALWAPLLADDAPVTIVVGDYYLLGEMDAAGNVTRLVREFFINSPVDFIEHLELDPERMQRYRNLDLTYLPVSSAFALHDLAPVLAPKERVQVMLASDLDGDTLASSHIVYIGYLSGLGMLGDRVFEASRLQLGGTYDELVDPATKRAYVARHPDRPGGEHIDYGYAAVLRGAGDKRIVIISGTRDLGVVQTARSLTDPKSLGAILEESEGAHSFESLSEVRGVARAGMSAERVFVSEIKKGLVTATH